MSVWFKLVEAGRRAREAAKLRLMLTVCDMSGICKRGRTSFSAEGDAGFASGRVVYLHGGLAGSGLCSGVELGRLVGLLLLHFLFGRLLLGHFLLLDLLGDGFSGLVPSKGEVALASGGVVHLD